MSRQTCEPIFAGVLIDGLHCVFERGPRIVLPFLIPLVLACICIAGVELACRWLFDWRTRA